MSRKETYVQMRERMFDLSMDELLEEATSSMCALGVMLKAG